MSIALKARASTQLLRAFCQGFLGETRPGRAPLLPTTATKPYVTRFARSITALPQQIRRSLTWDQGAAMAQHAKLRVDTDLDVYLCDPHSPWRETNENTNGLLRQYFPKGTDLSRHSRTDLDAVAAALNG